MPVLFDDERFPTVCDAVFAVAVAGDDGRAAITLWSRCEGYGIPLTLLEWSVEVLTAAAWDRIGERLNALLERCRPRGGTAGLWVEGEALAQQAESRGLRAKAIPAHVVAPDFWVNLGLIAGAYVDDGSVKMTRPAAEAMRTQPFAGLPRRAAGPRGVDPTLPAWLFGIVLGLDEAASRPPEPSRVKVVA